MPSLCSTIKITQDSHSRRLDGNKFDAYYSRSAVKGGNDTVFDSGVGV